MKAKRQVLPALDFDVATCPLLDSPFNRHKSALKYYEYAVTGSVTLASDVPPYRGEVTLLTGNDPAEWSDALEALLLDEPTRDRHLARQRAFVLEHRDIRRVRSRWQAALQEILRGGSVGRDPAEAGPPARRERTKRSDRAV